MFLTIFNRARSILLVAAILICGSQAQALAATDEISTSSHVVAATIFPDRAIVTREAKAHVGAGAHTIVVSEMPAGLNESSLRVQGKAGGAVKIGTVEVKRVFLTEAANAAQRDKQAAIQAAQDQKTMIAADVSALDARASFIDRIIAAGAEKTDAAGIAKLDFAPDKWAQAWNTIQNGMSETQKNIVAKNIEIRKIDEQIAKLQQELSQIQSSQAKERRDVRVQIEAAQDTDLQLTLTYQTGGARWAPVYDARLDIAKSTVAFEQYGQAMQQTGEDWNDVELTLSTAQPSFGSEMPRLTEWFVRLFKQVAYSNAAQLAAPASMAALKSRAVAEDSAANEADMVEAEPQQAIVQSSEYAAEFKVPGKVDLKSAKEPTKLFIGSAHMTATLSSQVTPRLAQQAFLFAKVKNEEKYPLIPGTVSKYRDGVFIGNAALPMLRPDETADLSFGGDDRIKITYRRTREEQNNPTLVVVGDMKIERQYEIKIQNLHQTPIDVTVFEQYPASADPDVKTELIDDVTTTGYSKDPENRQGVIIWTANYKPQEEKTYTIGYRVKYPKDKQLIGL